MTSVIAPPIHTATDPVHSTDDLRLRWLALMSPLGFGKRTLWMTFLGPDRCMQKVLSDLPATSERDRHCVTEVIAELRHELGRGFDAGLTVAFLLSRPGAGPVSDRDRQWAELVIGAAGTAGVPIEPFFRANDVSLVEVRTAPSS
jgi:hypothetical protein